MLSVLIRSITLLEVLPPPNVITLKDRFGFGGSFEKHFGFGGSRKTHFGFGGSFVLLVGLLYLWWVLKKVAKVTFAIIRRLALALTGASAYRRSEQFLACGTPWYVRTKRCTTLCCAGWTPWQQRYAVNPTLALALTGAFY